MHFWGTQLMCWFINLKTLHLLTNTCTYWFAHSFSHVHKCFTARSILVCSGTIWKHVDNSFAFLVDFQIVLSNQQLAHRACYILLILAVCIMRTSKVLTMVMKWKVYLIIIGYLTMEVTDIWTLLELLSEYLNPFLNPFLLRKFET